MCLPGHLCVNIELVTNTHAFQATTHSATTPLRLFSPSRGICFSHARWHFFCCCHVRPWSTMRLCLLALCGRFTFSSRRDRVVAFAARLTDTRDCSNPGLQPVQEILSEFLIQGFPLVCTSSFRHQGFKVEFSCSLDVNEKLCLTVNNCLSNFIGLDGCQGMGWQAWLRSAA